VVYNYNVPQGGSAGDALTKTSDTDHEVEWSSGIHASIHFQDFASPATGSPPVGSFSKVALFDENGASNGATPDHTANTITVPVDGDYEVSFAAVIGGFTNTLYAFAIYAGPSGSTTQTFARTATEFFATDTPVNISDSSIGHLDAGDVVELHFQADATKDITVWNLKMTVKKI